MSMLSPERAAGSENSSVNRRAAGPRDVFETRPGTFSGVRRRTIYKGAINEPGNSQGEFVGQFMGNRRDAGARRLLASPGCDRPGSDSRGPLSEDGAARAIPDATGCRNSL